MEQLQLDGLSCHPVFVVTQQEEEESAQDHEEAHHYGQDPVGHVHHVSSLGRRVLVLLDLDNLIGECYIQSFYTVDHLGDDIEKSHGDHDESQDDNIELTEGEGETTEEQEHPDVKIEEEEVVGDFVRRNESIKVQDLLGHNLLARLSEGNPSDGLDGVIPPVPVVWNIRRIFPQLNIRDQAATNQYHLHPRERSDPSRAGT